MSILTGWTALDCYLTSKEQFSAMIMVRTSCNWWDDDDVCFVPDSHTCKDNYRTSSMKQQSTGTHVTPLGHIILIPRQPVFSLTP